MKILCLFMVLLAGCRNRKPDVPIPPLLMKSSLVFVGTVVKTGASTLSEVPATPRHAIVRFDEVVTSRNANPFPPNFNVTIQAAEPIDLKPGTQRMFFTHVLIYSASVLLAEEGRVRDSREVRRVVLEAEKERPRQEWLTHVTPEAIVIEGVVEGVKSPPSYPGEGGGEHDTRWRIAVISLKGPPLVGKLPGTSVEVWFPFSRVNPKFQSKQSGIWILNRTILRGYKEPVYVSVDPYDYRPTAEDIEILKGRLVTGAAQRRSP